MTDNPIKPKSTRMDLSPQQWVDRGNRLLAGVEPDKEGNYLTPRNDVHWFLENGRAQIGWRVR